MNFYVCVSLKYSFKFDKDGQKQVLHVDSNGHPSKKNKKKTV